MSVQKENKGRVVVKNLQVKKPRVTTEKQAREFVGTSVFEHLNSCGEQMDMDFAAEISIFILASNLGKIHGVERLQELFDQVKSNLKS